MEYDAQETQIATASDKPRHITVKSVAGASATGLTVAGPLLGLAGFSFMLTLTLFLVASPVLLLFSPLLVGAAAVVAIAMAGFGAAAAMLVVGLAALIAAARQLGLSGRTVERIIQSALFRMKEMIGFDSGGGYLQDKVDEDSFKAD